MVISASQVNVLRRSLAQQLQLCRRLLEICEKQTLALIANDLPQLKHLETEQKICLEQQTLQEQIRLHTVSLIAQSLGEKQQAPTLAELLPRLGPRDQEVLGALRRDLKEVLESLEAVKGRNLLLLQNAQEYVRFSLELITGTMLQPSGYGANVHAVVSPTFYVDSRV